MRITLIAAGLAAAGSAAAIAGDMQASAGGKCLRFRDMRNLTRVDDSTLIANTRGTQKYIVKLAQPCRNFRWPDNYYTVRLQSNWECFDHDDALVFRFGGACFVQSVTPAPAT